MAFVLSYLAYKGVDFKDLVFFQIVASSTSQFVDFKPTNGLACYSTSDGHSYLRNTIVSILETAFVSQTKYHEKYLSDIIHKDKSPYELNQIYNEKKSKVVEQNEQTFSVYQYSLVCSIVCLYYESHLFDSHASTIQLIKSKFVSWFNNRELIQFLQIVEATLKNLNMQKIHRFVDLNCLNRLTAGVEISKKFVFRGIENDRENSSLSKEEVEFVKKILECNQESDQSTNKAEIKHEQYEKFPLTSNKFSIDVKSNELTKTYMNELEKSWNHHHSHIESFTQVELKNNMIETLKHEIESINLNLAKLSALIQQISEPENNALKSILLNTSFLPMTVPICIFKKLTNLTNVNKLYIQLISAYGALISLKHHQIRCIKYASESERIHHLKQELSNRPQSFWLAQNHPELLLLELELNITIRQNQINVAQTMINPPDNQSKMVIQLNMGEGKSTVIIPMLIAKLTATGQHLIRIFVLRSLFNSNYTYLAHTLGGLLNKRLYAFPFSRELNMSSMQVFKSLMEECMSGKHFVLTLPEYCLSFGLKTIEQCEKKSAQAVWLLDIKHFLEKHAKDVLDESDEILSVKYQIVYSVGKHFCLDGAKLRWELAQDVLKLARLRMKNLKNEYDESIEYFENVETPQRFPTMRLLNKVPFKKLRQQICEDYLNKTCPYITTWISEMRKDDKEILQRFILCDAIDLECREFINNIKDQNLMDKILILRGLLNYDILYLVLSKRWKVQYGVNETSQRLWQAVPFRAKDVPAERAQFAHPDIAIGLTELSYYYSGLNEKQLEAAFIFLNKSADADYTYEKWIQEIPTSLILDKSIREYKSLNLSDTTQMNTLLFPTLKYHPPVIDYWLSNLLFPKEAKEFESRLSMSAWDLCEQNRNLTVGFSGTNDSNILLPESMAYYPMPNLIGTSGKVISNLYSQNNDYDIYHSFGDNFDELGLLTKINESSTPVLLDVGALILRMTNEQVANEWLKLNQEKNEIEACVFFKGNDLVVREKRNNSKQTVAYSYETSAYKDNLKKCLIYLDESHCRGTDLSDTLGRGLTKDRLAQACMRMRLLGNGHSVTFYASSEVHTQIMSRVNNASNYKPNCVDVLEWSIDNSLLQIMNDFYYWSIQGLTFIKKQCSNIELSFDKDEDFYKFFTNCKEECSNKLSPMYGKDRLESLISEIIEEKIQKNNPVVNLDRFKSETQKLIAKLKKKINNFKKFSQLLEEEVEMEIEKEQEEEQELQRPAKAIPKKNRLDSDVVSFVQSGNFNLNSSSFLSLGQSLKNSSLSRFIAENKAWSSTLFVTRDFFETVELNNFSDDYLAVPRWIAVQKASNKKLIAVVLSGFEVNELMHRFLSCQLIMLMPRMRYGQRLLFSLCDNVDKILPESMIQELSIFSGSMYLNTSLELECLLNLIGFVPVPRSPRLQKHFDDKNIELNGFVLSQNRAQVFEDLEQSERDCLFFTDPSKFIIQLILIRNYSIVPNSAHHLEILSKGRKPVLK